VASHRIDCSREGCSRDTPDGCLQKGQPLLGTLASLIPVQMPDPTAPTDLTCDGNTGILSYRELSGASHNTSIVPVLLAYALPRAGSVLCRKL
jgi:hypothetical protein